MDTTQLLLKQTSELPELLQLVMEYTVDTLMVFTVDTVIKDSVLTIMEDILMQVILMEVILTLDPHQLVMDTQDILTMDTDNIITEDMDGHTTDMDQVTMVTSDTLYILENLLRKLTDPDFRVLNKYI